MTVASVILGGLSILVDLVGLWYVGLAFSLMGLYLGIVVGIRNDDFRKSGAKGGILISIAGLLFSILVAYMVLSGFKHLPTDYEMLPPNWFGG